MQQSPNICRMVFHLAQRRHGNLRPRAELRHPLAQRRNRDLAADDDHRARSATHDQHAGRALTSSNSAVATISLSATGSRNSPSGVVCAELRAR